MSIVIVHDCVGANVGKLPPGPAAGYVTGFGVVPWSAAQLDAHPGVVRIDQSPYPGVWDVTADVDDYERGAVTLQELPRRALARVASFAHGSRPGQRMPMVYASQDNISAVANALIAGGAHGGVWLWVANWSTSEPAAAAAVVAAAGPFPIGAWQFTNGPDYDTSVFSADYLAAQSAAGGVAHPTDGVTSLGGYATARNMQVVTWVQEQVRLNPVDAADLVGQAVPPIGLIWRSN